MGATEATQTQRVQALTDDPASEGQSVRGLVFGLLIAALLWLFMAGLALALF